MITKVMAVNRKTMEHLKEEGVINSERHVVISIIDPDMEPIFSEDTDNIITQKFHDINIATLFKLQSKNQFKAFDHKQATQIVDFLIKHQASEKDLFLIVNCSAGICRSGAIVTFAHFMCETDDIQFTQDNPTILPNEWVLNKLAEVFMSED